MPKVSVIIPVYNTEKFLRKCLDSVCNQTLQDIEIICINDCSTDGSLEILREYAGKDNRIKLIELLENCGAAKARNIGIDIAEGEYLGFVDSDDFIDLDFYEKLYQRAVETKADAAKGVYKYSKNGFIELSINQKIEENKFNFVCEYCSAIFKRKLVREFHLYFPDIIEMEDPVFAFSFAIKAHRVEVVSDAVINIVTHEDSQTAGIPSIERIKAKLEGLKYMLDLANTSDISKEAYGYIFALWFRTITVSALKNKSLEIRKFFAESIIKLSRELKFVQSFKTELKKLDKELLKCIDTCNVDELIILNETNKILFLQGINKEQQKTIEIQQKQKESIISRYVINCLRDSVGENVILISVVNNYEKYKKCISDNPFVEYPSNIRLVDFDNTKDNVYISKRYNSFLNSYDLDNEAWFVFCHCDWELQEDINPILKSLDKTGFYGPVGSKLHFIKDKIYRELTGGCYERRRDGSGLHFIGKRLINSEYTDTFDCQAFIVHSSLIKKYRLRFDENLQWDLYIEDMCIGAKQKYGINSYAIKLDCCHWSGYHVTPKSYYDSLKYINHKYPDGLWGGTVSLIGGKDIEVASEKDILFHKLRQGIL